MTAEERRKRIAELEKELYELRLEESAELGEQYESFVESIRRMRDEEGAPKAIAAYRKYHGCGLKAAYEFVHSLK